MLRQKSTSGLVIPVLRCPELRKKKQGKVLFKYVSFIFYITKIIKKPIIPFSPNYFPFKIRGGKFRHKESSFFPLKEITVLKTDIFFKR